MIVLINSSEPFIGEHRGDGSEVGGREMFVAVREETKEFAYGDSVRNGIELITGFVKQLNDCRSSGDELYDRSPLLPLQ